MRALRAGTVAAAIAAAGMAPTCTGDVQCPKGPAEVQVRLPEQKANVPGSGSFVTHGLLGSSCGRDSAFAGSGAIRLLQFSWDNCASPSLALFRPRQGPILVNACPRDEHGCCLSDWSVPSTPPETLRVVGYAVGNNYAEMSHIAERIVREAAAANSLFDSVGVGITLSLHIDSVLEGSGLADAIGHSCDNALRFAEAVKGELDDPRTVVAVYVKWVDVGAGATCWLHDTDVVAHRTVWDTTRSRRVILLATEIENPGSLAHEIGHALGQVRPWNKRGHADEMDFAGVDSNLMNSTSRFAPTAVTLGQRYRMHVDSLALALGPPEDRVVRDCGDDPFVSEPCIPLARQAAQSTTGNQPVPLSMHQAGAHPTADGPYATPRIITRWLSCIDCANGQLDSVVTRSRTDGSVLVTLRTALRAGPDADSMSADSVALIGLRARLGTRPTVSGLVAHLPKPDVYVRRYLASYRYVWRLRAARALGAIGSRALAACPDLRAVQADATADLGLRAAAGHALLAIGCTAVGHLQGLPLNAHPVQLPAHPGAYPPKH